jgi:small subunit ribosomal protein S20
MTFVRVKLQGVNRLANIKSAIKRVKITEKQNLRNRMVKSEMKTTIRRFDEAMLSGDAAAADKAFVTAVKTVDQAVGKGVIHKNAAGRKKAQMAKKRAAAAAQ